MSKEKNCDEIQKEFLDHIWNLIDYWKNESRTPELRDKLSGLAHSILSTLDGNMGVLPGFIVAPNSHPSDTEYYLENEEDYYPEAPEVKCDIAGNLHEMFHQFDPQKFTKSKPTQEEIPTVIKILDPKKFESEHVKRTSVVHETPTLTSINDTFFDKLRKEKEQITLSAEEREKPLTQWLNQLDALMKQLLQWLEPAIQEGTILIEEIQKTCTEPKLGKYQAPALRLITSAGRSVRLDPIGCQVLGAMGRIDINSGPHRAMLLQMEPNIWKIKMGISEMSDLNTQNFLELLLKVLY